MRTQALSGWVAVSGVVQAGHRGERNLTRRQALIAGQALRETLRARSGVQGGLQPAAGEQPLAEASVAAWRAREGSAQTATRRVRLSAVTSPRLPLFGGVDVRRVPAEARHLGLMEARRAAKALERGTSDG